MKRTTRHPVRPLLLELHIILYNPNDVCLSFEIVDECLGVTHLSVWCFLWRLLSQLNYGCTSTALIRWRGYEAGDVGMAVQQPCNGTTQRAGAVPVNNSYLAQTRQRCFVKKFVNSVDCFISRLSNHVQLRSRFLFSTRQMNLGVRGSFQLFQFALLSFWNCLGFDELQLFEPLPESQRLHSHFRESVFDLIDDPNRSE